MTGHCIGPGRCRAALGEAAQPVVLGVSEAAEHIGGPVGAGDHVA